jgi:uncharacterized protein DUF1064
MSKPLGRVSKYHAVPTVIDNVRFASKKEASRYCELKLLLKAGEIALLAVHPEFDLLASTMAGAECIGTYTADFRYTEKDRDGTHRLVVEDVKGGRATRTEAYRLRKRILKANYGIEIRET